MKWPRHILFAECLSLFQFWLDLINLLALIISDYRWVLIFLSLFHFKKSYQHKLNAAFFFKIYVYTWNDYHNLLDTSISTWKMNILTSIQNVVIYRFTKRESFFVAKVITSIDVKKKEPIIYIPFSEWIISLILLGNIIVNIIIIRQFEVESFQHHWYVDLSKKSSQD